LVITAYDSLPAEIVFQIKRYRRGA